MRESITRAPKRGSVPPTEISPPAVKTFAAITTNQACPLCGRTFPTRDVWLLHVGIAHIEYALRILESVQL